MSIKDFTCDQLRFQTVWSSYKISPRLVNASFANYQPSCQEKKRALEICQAFAAKGLEIIQQGQGLLLQGPVGTGKSHLVVSILRSLLENNVASFGLPPGKFNLIDDPDYEGYYCSMISVVDLFEILRESFSNDQMMPAARNILHRAKCDDLGILDDIGAEKPSEWAEEKLYAIIDMRYRMKRSTFFTTNCTIKELEQQIGSRSVSRIQEMCKGVRVGGEDWRKKRMGL